MGADDPGTPKGTPAPERKDRAMTANSGQEPTSSRTTRHEPTTSGTAAGADVTARMAGTHDRDREYDRREHETVVRATEDRHIVRPAKTSAAAAFALVFGLAALFCALTAILAPAAVVFGLIGLVLGIAGIKMSKRQGVTGKGVAIGGLITAVLGLLLGAAVLVGASVLVNDEQRLDQLENRLTELRNDLPSTQQIQEEIPG